MCVIDRPAIGIAAAFRGLLRQPPGMRKAYVSATLQYLLPEQSLVGVLTGLVPEAGRENAKAAVARATSDPYIRGVLDQSNKVQGALSVREMIFLHALVLLKKPEMMIETGVAHGSSSVAILSAMEKVQKGELYSIDLPMVEAKGVIGSASP